MENDKSTNDNLENWTKEDKFELLLALKENGSYDIDGIHEALTNKSKDEIKTAIEYYKKKALVHPTINQRKNRSKLNNIPSVPLTNWAKSLIDAYGFEDLQTDTATALRLIADFEDRPQPACTDRIDFKKVYHVLADALEGKPIPNNRMISCLFDKCMVETALTSKAFIRNTAFKQVLQSINMTEKNVNVLSKPSTDNELVTLRHLASQKNYNPLNISEEYLKSSLHA